MSLSKIVISGKVIKAPEKRFTPNNNTAVTEFFIAVESIPRADAQPESTPVRIITWRDLAERCANEIKKGDPVVVEGRLQINSFVSNEGQKRRDIEIDAVNVENLAKSLSKMSAILNTDTDESSFAPATAQVSGSYVSQKANNTANSDDLASIFASDDEIPF
jgi:single-strand DNA-binding protein